MGGCWTHSPEYFVASSVAYRGTLSSLLLVFERMCLSIRHSRWRPGVLPKVAICGWEFSNGPNLPSSSVQRTIRSEQMGRQTARLLGSPLPLVQPSTEPVVAVTPFRNWNIHPISRDHHIVVDFFGLCLESLQVGVALGKVRQDQPTGI
jgi:hypothetical protein